MNRKLMIARSVMMVAFGVFFLVAPFVLPLNVDSIWPRIGLSLTGVVILAVEAWSWKKRLSSPEDR